MGVAPSAGQFWPGALRTAPIAPVAPATRSRQTSRFVPLQRAFADQVARFLESEMLVRRLSAGVVFLDVEPQANDIPGVAGPFHQRAVQGAEHAVPPVLLADVDTLHPPEPAVAPVAPFERRHHLSDDLATRFRDQIKPAGRVREDPGDA